VASMRSVKKQRPSGPTGTTLLEGELRQKGIADVMVFLKTTASAIPAAAKAAAVSASGGDAPSASLALAASAFASFGQLPPELPADLKNCFESPYEESNEAGFTSLSLRASTASSPKSALSGYQVSPVTYLDRLGMVLGSVSSSGLRALRRHKMVSDVRPIPELSLIRPRKMALAKPSPEISWGLKRLNIPYLWTQGLDGEGVRIGHLDTGADGTHPMLKDAFAAFAEFNYVGKQVFPDPQPHDTDLHGTHTAGTIVGRPLNGHQMGAASKAKLASGIVIEGGKVTFRILAGLNWTLHQGVHVLSMSLGIPGKADDFLDITKIIRQQGVFVIVAIGNEGQGTSRYPGNYPTVLSVGAMDEKGDVADFSSSDKMPPPPRPSRIVPDLVGPGVNIVSCAPGGRYMSMDGTSMATPHLAGLAALLIQSKPGVTPDSVQQAIHVSCKLTAPMTRDRANRGVPDAKVALANL
jgi:subtilisin